MATLYSYYMISGTNTPNGSGDYRAELDYSYSQNPSANQSTISATDYIKSLNYPSSSPGNITGGINIDGTWYSATKLLNTNTRSSVLSKSITVTHDTAGNRTVFLQGRVGTTPGTVNTQSIYLALPQISRYANITYFSVTNGGLKQANVSWNADANCDLVQYRIKESGGNYGDWITAQTGDISSGSFSIGGLQPGKTYIIQILVRRKDSQLLSYSGEPSVTTTDIARVSNIIDNFTFNVDTDLSVQFTNPSGSQVNVFLDAPAGTRILTRTNVTSPYNIVLTTAERNLLYSLTNNPNKNTTIRVGVDTVNGSDTWSSYKSGIGFVINANPTFTDFDYADVNPVTLAITGSPSKFIKGFSNAKISIPVAKRAIAVKGASMAASNAYKFESPGLIAGYKDYSSSVTVEYTLNNIIDDTLTVTATDTRSNTTQVSKDVQFIDYTNPSILSFSARRTNNVQSQTKLIFNGVFTDWKGLTVANIIVTAKYRYKKVNGAYSGYTNITLLTNANGQFSFDGFINGDLGASGFDSTENFILELTVTDKLGNAVAETPLNSAKPLLWKFKGLVSGVLKSILGIGKQPNTSLPHGSVDIAGDLNVDGRILNNGVELGIVGEPIWWPYPENTIPAGFIKAEGQAINRNTYSRLFAVSGTLHGSGDGSTTFNVLDMRGRVPVGFDSGQTEFDTIGEYGGAKTHNHTSAWHDHPSSWHQHGAGSLQAAINISTAGNIFIGQSGSGWTGWPSKRGGSGSYTTVNGDSNSTGAFVYGATDGATPGNVGGVTPGNTGYSNNLMPYRVGYWIIKY